MSANPLSRPQDQAVAGSVRRQEGWRVAIVTPQPLMRDMLARWLTRLGAPCGVTALADGAELERLVQAGQRFHAVVVGCLGTPWPQVLAALPDIERLAGVPVIIVPECDDAELITAALRKGVRGIVPTSLEPAVAAAAVHLVLSGGTFVPAHRLCAPAPPPSPQTPALDALIDLGLTLREAEVVALLQQGCSNRAIGKALGISESTVVVHVRNLMQKLAATNRAQAVYMVHQRLRNRTQPQAEV